LLVFLGAILLSVVSSLTVVFADDDNEFEFIGTVQSFPPGFVGDWMIGGKTVHVTSATEIDQEEGMVAVGVTVQVEGALRADGSIDAKQIEVQEREQEEITFKGTIMSLPPPPFIGDWKVGGKIVHVTATTRVDQEEGPVAVGAFVSVEGTQRADGSIDATKIEVLSNVSGDDGRTELEGVVQHLPPGGSLIGDWMVSGRIVHVTASTNIEQEHGQVMVGSQVEVKGTLRSDGSLDAKKIEVKEMEQGDQDAHFKGSIQSMPGTPDMSGDWMVAGVTVHVTRSTRLAGNPAAFVIGGRVKVGGSQRSDGSVDAARIKGQS